MDPEKTLHNVYSYAGGLIEYVKWLNTDKVSLASVAIVFGLTGGVTTAKFEFLKCSIIFITFIFKSCSICFNIFLLPIVRYDLHISGPETFA